ncbi:MAG TPA: STAS domain-containing protein [Propionibacteriaceae bacterium]|nr:STAS domain-containing protein [Propionibacteriaceae bacterium]
MWWLPQDIARGADRPVIHVRGDLDIGSVSRYLRVVRQGLGGGDRRLDVDLAGVTFVDVAGLRALLDAERAARRSGRELRYRQPSGAVVRLARLLVLPHVRSSIGLDAAGGTGAGGDSASVLAPARDGPWADSATVPPQGGTRARRRACRAPGSGASPAPGGPGDRVPTAQCGGGAPSGPGWSVRVLE